MRRMQWIRLWTKNDHDRWQQILGCKWDFRQLCEAPSRRRLPLRTEKGFDCVHDHRWQSNLRPLPGQSITIPYAWSHLWSAMAPLWLLRDPHCWRVEIHQQVLVCGRLSKQASSERHRFLRPDSLLPNLGYYRNHDLQVQGPEEAPQLTWGAARTQHGASWLSLGVR